MNGLLSKCGGAAHLNGCAILGHAIFGRTVVLYSERIVRKEEYFLAAESSRGLSHLAALRGRRAFQRAFPAQIGLEISPPARILIESRIHFFA
jgi:hypothetical protein